MSPEILCPLCERACSLPYYSDKKRVYHQCQGCQLVYVPPQYHLSPTAEKAEYDLHQNSPDDLGYRRFLSRITEPLLERLKPYQKGLDFGCGPGPALSLMMTEAGHEMDIYDPYYFPDAAVFEKRYDFISATEVIEHVSRPKQVFHQLLGRLNSGGTLGLMTKLVLNQSAFAGWHYIQDPTHICFYSRGTFEYISRIYDARLEILGQDVILLTL